jgi:hypothetical protein
MEMFIGLMFSPTFRGALATVALALSMTAVVATDALAHCDTMDGPVVAAARRALETGSANHVLIWVRPQDEPEVRAAFRQALSVRTLGSEARQLADRYFFETVVRVHRQGEGEAYTGLKPAGTDPGAAIPAADRALASGSIAELEALLDKAVRHGLHARFARALATRDFPAEDVASGRAHVAAYVALTHYAEAVHGLGAATAHPPGGHKTP